jgi:hypothetical protein
MRKKMGKKNRGTPGTMRKKTGRDREETTAIGDDPVPSISWDGSQPGSGRIFPLGMDLSLVAPTK